MGVFGYDMCLYLNLLASGRVWFVLFFVCRLIVCAGLDVGFNDDVRIVICISSYVMVWFCRCLGWVCLDVGFGIIGLLLCKVR